MKTNSEPSKFLLKNIHLRNSKRSSTFVQPTNKKVQKHTSKYFGGKSASFKANGRQGRRKRYSLVTKFLLGGNVTDPLNLNGLDQNEIQWSPAQSPLPVPLHRRLIPRICPRDRSDPLNLNLTDDIEPVKKKKKRNRKRLSNSESLDSKNEIEKSPTKSIVNKSPSSVAIISPEKPCILITAHTKPNKNIDKIVSPVISQVDAVRKRRRTISSSDTNDPSLPIKEIDKNKIDVVINQNKSGKVVKKPKFLKNRNEEFIYGNYNRYYGYRNPSNIEDKRLSVMDAMWFDGNDILDVGCNVGHVTLYIAKHFNPKKIIGCDIDRKLLKAAKTNIRNYMADDFPQFPVSMKEYGPIAAPVMVSNRAYSFPHNVHFMHCNYALESDEKLELVQEEYDVILALSITKWIHLHHGDDGIKRCFKRMFKQLRPGGKLILEPQSWDSYKKKKRLTESIFKAFNAIIFKPEMFKQFLLSKQVGFSSCENLSIPFNKSKGFSRPIMVFYKSYMSPNDCTPRTRILNSQSTTPIHYSGFSASFTIGSGSTTPFNDTMINSAYATPNKDNRLDSLPGTPFKDYISDSKCATPSKDSYCSLCENVSPHSTPSNKCHHQFDENRSLGELRTQSAPSSLYQYEPSLCPFEDNDD